MKSFEYDGQSTNTIVDKPLMIVQFDRTTDIDGFVRTIQKGEKTLVRQDVNHYGTMYSDDSVYPFYLIKEDGSKFTEIEHRKINKWLTSPTLPKPITAVTDDNETVIYKGVFTSIGWKTITGNKDAVMCELTCDTPMCWKKETKTYQSQATTPAVFEISSDDSEYVIYPKIIIKIPSGTEQQTINIKNNDDGGTLSVLCNPNLPIYIDCKNCMITDGTVTGVIDFEDIGWSDVGKIYWMKLKDGTNNLSITGNCTVTLEYEVPIKRVGDFV